MGGKSKKRKSIFHIVLIACILALGAFYLFEVNSIAKERFELLGTKENLAEIQEKNTALEIGVSEAMARYNSESLSAALGLEEVRRISYIEIKDASPLVLRDKR